MTDEELAGKVSKVFRDSFPDPLEHCKDPLNIDDLGKAMEVYRDLKPMTAKEYIKACGPVFQMAGYVMLTNDLEQIAVIKEWLLEDATPQQIWRICLLAKEK